MSPWAWMIVLGSSLKRRISNSPACMRRLTAMIRSWSDVALNASNIPIATNTDTAVRPATGASRSSGSNRLSRSAPKARFNVATKPCSRNVTEAPQLLLDFLFGIRLLELSDLLFQGVRDELVDRGVAGQVGVSLHFREQSLVETDFARSKHCRRLGREKLLLCGEAGDPKFSEDGSGQILK